MGGGWQRFTPSRKSRLPADWQERRFQARLRAGGRCQWMTGGDRCRAAGTDCDHIVAGDDHSPDNLQWLCKPHHAVKSAREGGTSRQSRFRPPEEHPAFR